MPRLRVPLLSAFAGFLLVSVSASAAFSPMLINGKEVKPGEYPQVVQIVTGTSGCTATIVGENVIVTAAHCAKAGEVTKFKYDGEVYEAELTISPKYKTSDHDLAIGVTSETIRGVKPISIGGKAVVGTELTLMGYGCTKDPRKPQPPPPQEDDGGDDWWPFPWPWSRTDGPQKDLLRMGTAKVTKFNAFDMVSGTPGGAALCFGDSGGPAFVKDGANFLLLGVNSKGNIKDTNYNLRLDMKESVDMLTKYAKDEGVDICGINKVCK